MGDESGIREIISEVDTDNVSFLLYFTKVIVTLCSHFGADAISIIGWEDQLYRVLYNDEEWTSTSKKALLVTLKLFSTSRGV